MFQVAKKLYINILNNTININMALISEIVVQELLKEGNTYPNRYALSIKIAGKNLQSNNLAADEIKEINRILELKGIPFRLQ
jgi:hypothetical protein